MGLPSKVLAFLLTLSFLAVLIRIFTPCRRNFGDVDEKLTPCLHGISSSKCIRRCMLKYGGGERGYEHTCFAIERRLSLDLRSSKPLLNEFFVSEELVANQSSRFLLNKTMSQRRIL